MIHWWKYSGHHFAVGKQRGALKFYFAFQKKGVYWCLMDARFDFTVINGENLRIGKRGNPSSYNCYNRCNRSGNVINKRKAT